MEELHLELNVDATRRSMVDAVCRHLAPGQWEGIRELTEGAHLAAGHYHDLAVVEEALKGARLDEETKRDVRAVYRILAQAEAQAHGCAVGEMHFHEVGSGETLKEIVSFCMAIESLAPQCISATKVQVGSGTVQCAHGVLDIPAPATSAIIGWGIPVCEEKIPGERCTPTSAALIYHFVDRFE